MIKEINNVARVSNRDEMQNGDDKKLVVRHERRYIAITRLK